MTTPDTAKQKGRPERRWATRCAVLALWPLLPQPAPAQVVSDCDWRASAIAIAEPWEQNTRQFANGAIRVAVMDLVEPAAGAFHLLLLSPPLDELGVPQCKLVSLSDDLGFADLTLDRIQAHYDPARGLTLLLAAKRRTDGDIYQDARLSVTINQASGAIAAALE